VGHDRHAAYFVEQTTRRLFDRIAMSIEHSVKRPLWLGAGKRKSECMTKAVDLNQSSNMAAAHHGVCAFTVLACKT
jgi:hypothetical protein